MALLIPLLIYLSPLLLSHPASGLTIALRPTTVARGVSLTHNKRYFAVPTASSRNMNIGRPLSRNEWKLSSGAQSNDNVDGDDVDGSSIVERDQSDQSADRGTSTIDISSNISSNSNNNNDPSLTQIMSLMGTSPRRVFLSVASSTTIAFAANFCGITSNLLSALPEEAVERSGLDSFYPRGDYKRATARSTNSLGIASNSGKCSFLIPKEWVADTSLALAQAQRQARSLDYSMMTSSQQENNVLPDAAYGPPGRLDNQGLLSNGDTNVSVIINTGVKNFSLASALGSDPTSAAEVLLSSKFGPNRRPTKLVAAVEEERRGGGGDDGITTPVYQFEYTVDRGESVKPLRAISVVAGSTAGDAFVTLTVVSTEEEWMKPLVNERLRRVAESFKLV